MDHANELLSRIHAQGIRPVPRWRVRLALAGRFALFCAAALLGTLSVALAVQEFHAHAGRGWLLRQALSELAPYVWSLTAVAMVGVGIRLFRELPRGWRVRPWMVGASLALFCLAGGWAVEGSDALLVLHRMVARQVPAYREAWMRKALVSWHHPEQGRISGSWVSRDSGGLVLEAVDGTRWGVRWEGNGPLSEAPSIRLEGRVCGERIFCADGWKPAPGSGRGRNRER